jgi:hypothetical protein
MAKGKSQDRGQGHAREKKNMAAVLHRGNLKHPFPGWTGAEWR